MLKIYDGKRERKKMVLYGGQFLIRANLWSFFILLLTLDQVEREVYRGGHKRVLELW